MPRLDPNNPFRAPVFGFNVPYPSGGYGPGGPAPGVWDPTQPDGPAPAPKLTYNLPPRNAAAPGATAVGPPTVSSPSIGSQIAAQQVATAPGSSAGAIPGAGGIPKYNQDVFSGDTTDIPDTVDTGGGENGTPAADAGTPITDEQAKQLEQDYPDVARDYAMLMRYKGPNQSITIKFVQEKTYGQGVDVNGQKTYFQTGEQTVPRLSLVNTGAGGGTLQRRVIGGTDGDVSAAQIYEGRWDANGNAIGPLKRVPLPGEKYTPVLGQNNMGNQMVTDSGKVPGWTVTYIPDAEGKPIPNSVKWFENKNQHTVMDEEQPDGSIKTVTRDENNKVISSVIKKQAQWQLTGDTREQSLDGVVYSEQMQYNPVTKKSEWIPYAAKTLAGVPLPKPASQMPHGQLSYLGMRANASAQGQAESALPYTGAVPQYDFTRSMGGPNPQATSVTFDTGQAAQAAEDQRRREITGIGAQGAANNAAYMQSPSGQINSGRTPPELAPILNVAAGSPLPRVNVPPMSLDAYNRLNGRAQQALRIYLLYLGINPDTWEQQQLAMWSSGGSAGGGVRWNTVRQGR